MADYPDKLHGIAGKVADVAQAGPKESLDDLYDRVMRKPGASQPRPSIENKGAVGLMVLPQGWTSGPSQSGLRGADYYVSFHPPESEKTLISLSYDGRRHDKASSEQFLRSIDHRSASRNPQLTADERRELGGILGVRGDQTKFKMDTAAVEKIDGRNVLVVSGSYNSTNTRETAVYVDADGKGSSIQVLALQAPAADYGRYEPHYKTMLQNLIWSR